MHCLRHKLVGSLGFLAIVAAVCGLTPALGAEPEPAAAKAAPATTRDRRNPLPPITTTAKSQAVAKSAATTPGAAHGKAPAEPQSIVGEFWYNFRHNLFKPLLLF